MVTKFEWQLNEEKWYNATSIIQQVYASKDCCSKQAANAPGGSSLAASNQVTLGYNLARAKEAAGNLAQASKEYQDILAEFPEYLDCYFRLAWISRNKGNHADALRWAEKALEVKEKDPNALALIGTSLVLADLEPDASLNELQMPHPPGFNGSGCSFYMTHC